jgi:Cell division protein CrgA
MAEKSSSGRFTPKKSDEPVKGLKNAKKDEDAPAVPAYQSSGRYTAPTARANSAASNEALDSPPWVAWLMFAFFGVGLIIIMCNYMFEFLPDSPNNWYLLGGLGAIIAGFITATRLR